MRFDDAIPIRRVCVQGFKSIADKADVELRPLTILAGANSSGKSAILQPLLLLKQTVESGVDVSPLRLDGPYLKAPTLNELVTRRGTTSRAQEMRFGFEYGPGEDARIFEAVLRSGRDGDAMTVAENRYDDRGAITRKGNVRVSRAFLIPELTGNGGNFDRTMRYSLRADELSAAVASVVYVPAIRNSLGSGQLDLVHPPYVPECFDRFVTQQLFKWQEGEKDSIQAIKNGLAQLQLTRALKIVRLSDSEFETRVGRTLRAGERDLVRLADVGTGVGQVLPVLTALQFAETQKLGQLVYIDQPELHLHPRAQDELASIVVRAVQRGVRIVCETHSSLLLLGVLRSVAQGEIGAADVALHWAMRDPRSGNTTIDTADLSAAGQYADWPVDFDDVELSAQQRYLDAVERRRTAS